MLDVLLWLVLTVLSVSTAVLFYLWRARHDTNEPFTSVEYGSDELSDNNYHGQKPLTWSSAIKRTKGTYPLCCCCFFRPFNERPGCAALCCGNTLIAFILSYGVMVALIAVYVAAFKNSLVFVPTKYDACTGCEDDQYCCNYDTKRVSFTDVYVQDDKGGEILHGWWMENNTGSKGAVNIFYNHGSGRNVAVVYRLERYEYILSLGNVRLWVYDYPGYGRSTGSPTASGVLASADVALRWFGGVLGDGTNVTNTTSGPDTPFRVTASGPVRALSNITFLGRSIGGGVATAVGVAEGWSIRGLILQSTFFSLARTGRQGFPVGGWVVSAVLQGSFSRYGSGDNIANYEHCLYQSHSKDDEIVHIKEALDLHAAASGVPQIAPDGSDNCDVFLEVIGLKHDDPMTQGEKDTLALWVNAQRL